MNLRIGLTCLKWHYVGVKVIHYTQPTGDHDLGKYVQHRPCKQSAYHIQQSLDLYLYTNYLSIYI